MAWGFPPVPGSGQSRPHILRERQSSPRVPDVKWVRGSFGLREGEPAGEGKRDWPLCGIGFSAEASLPVGSVCLAGSPVHSPWCPRNVPSRELYPRSHEVPTRVVCLGKHLLWLQNFLLFSLSLDLFTFLGFSGGTSGKEPTCQCRCKRRRFDPWVRKIPWRRAWPPTPVFLPGESHGRRSWRATESMVWPRVGHN